MTIGTAIVLAPYILASKGPEAVKTEWKANSWHITAAGLLTFIAYGLVLTAFSLSRVSYVAPAREVGIVIGVLMGIILLKEPFGKGRLFGSILIVSGLALISVSK